MSDCFTSDDVVRKLGRLRVQPPPPQHHNHAYSIAALQALEQDSGAYDVYYFGCDRGDPKKASMAKGLPRNSKKVGCEVEYRFYFNRLAHTWYVCQIGTHCHGTHSDRWTALSEAAKNAIQFLARQGMTAFDIEKALRDGRNTKAYMSMIPGLTKADLDTVTVDSVQNELNRVRRYVRSHADEREAVKHLAALGPEFFPEGLKVEDLDDGVFRALICTDFQAVMLREFGDFCLLDSVHSAIRNGMNQLTVMVIDEFGRGVPVGFALVTSEDAASWKSLLEYCFLRAGRSPGETATMSDCDPTIIAATRDIGVQRHLLCAFHMQQAIGRRLKPSGTAVRDCWKGLKKQSVIDWVMKTTLARTRSLRFISNEKAFVKEAEAFFNDLRSADSFKHVRTYLGDNVEDFLKFLQDNWLHLGKACMWARFGRTNLPARQGHDTTNLLENWFRLQKYCYATKRRLTGIHQHVIFLVEECLPGVHRRREGSVKGLMQSNKEKNTRTLDRQKEWLLDGKQPHRVQVRDADRVQGLVSRKEDDSAGSYHDVCLADLSCTCGDSRDGVCIHLEAMAAKQRIGVTRDMVDNCVKYINEYGLLEEKAEPGRYKCMTLASHERSQEGGKERYVHCNTTPGSEYCSCDVHSLSGGGLCPHLVAAMAMADAGKFLQGEQRTTALVSVEVPFEDVEAFRPTRQLLPPETLKLIRESCWLPNDVNRPQYRHKLENKLQEVTKAVRLTPDDPDALAAVDSALDDIKSIASKFIRPAINAHSERTTQLGDNATRPPNATKWHPLGTQVKGKRTSNSQVASTQSTPSVGNRWNHPADPVSLVNVIQTLGGDDQRPGNDGSGMQAAVGSNATGGRRLGVAFTPEDLRRITDAVGDDSWFTGNIVGSIMTLLRARNERRIADGDADIPNCCFFDPLFFQQLCGVGLDEVLKWRRRDGLYSAAKVFFPMNVSRAHWVIAVADPGQHRIDYYDSMRRSNVNKEDDDGVSGVNDAQTESSMSLLVQYMRAARQLPANGPAWSWRHARCPQQENAVDCGVFVCLLAYHISSGRRVDDLLSLSIDTGSLRASMRGWLEAGHIPDDALPELV